MLGAAREQTAAAALTHTGRSPFVPAEIEAELIRCLSCPVRRSSRRAWASTRPRVTPTWGAWPTGRCTGWHPAGPATRRRRLGLAPGTAGALMAGVKVDDAGRLWAAGGYDGTLWVYDFPSRALLARLDVGSRPSCVNDIAFAGGAAYVTDSVIPRLFRAGGDPPVLEPWADLAGQGMPWPDGDHHRPPHGPERPHDADHLGTVTEGRQKNHRGWRAIRTVHSPGTDGDPARERPPGAGPPVWSCWSRSWASQFDLQRYRANC